MTGRSAVASSSAAGGTVPTRRRAASARTTIKPGKADKTTSESKNKTPTCYGFPVDSLEDTSRLPDFDTDFLPPEHIEAFKRALAVPDTALLSPTAASAPGTAADDGGASSAYQRSPTGSVDPFNHQSHSHLHFTKRNSIASATSDAEPLTPTAHSSSSLFITAKNDWAPVYEKVVPAGARMGLRRSLSALWARKPWRSAPTPAAVPNIEPAPPGPAPRKRASAPPKRRRTGSSSLTAANGRRIRSKVAKAGRRTRDETREGYLYGLLKWPFLLCVFAWIIGLSVAYLLTRMYIAAYEQLVTWRGQRERLRRRLRATSSYSDWVGAARKLDTYLENDRWKEENEFAFYDYRTVRRVYDQLRKCRARAEKEEPQQQEASSSSTAPDQKPGAGSGDDQQDRRAVEDLKAVVEACVKNNFAGVENRHLYSRTYYGTKHLVQNFIDEVERCLLFLIKTNQLDAAEKRALFKSVHANYGRTALCLSGGASFAFYHFGVVKALLDQDLLPDVITGTSGGALVAALVATRTDDELRQLLVPALARRITACFEPATVWIPRWWRTGARFDSVIWAQQCSWWTRGSTTFREAYERTGRVLNVTCVPADPHSPTILCNYRTAPDCVIWSAVLASAAVPGILNPVVLMMKRPDTGELVPYSFGHKWKDGSLRTDIPIRSLNLHFNVNFTMVSQTNPHVNLFFFSSRGSVGQPVTHRKGRGWRGGYLGSAFEEYLKQDLRKWLKLLRNLELLPRPLGQDWSQLWLQPFSGTITIWPKSIPSDFVHILSDPPPARLARMIHEGQQSAFPPLKFVSNRLRVERLIERGRVEARVALAAQTGQTGQTTPSRRRRTSSGMGIVGMGLEGVGMSDQPGSSSNGHRLTSSVDSLPSDEERRRGLAQALGDQIDEAPYGGHFGGRGRIESTTASTEEDDDDDEDDEEEEEEEDNWSDSSDSEVGRVAADDADFDEEPVPEEGHE